jgi:hypothetical protein
MGLEEFQYTKCVLIPLTEPAVRRTSPSEN